MASAELVLLNDDWCWKCAANESSQLSHDGLVSNGLQIGFKFLIRNGRLIFKLISISEAVC